MISKLRDYLERARVLGRGRGATRSRDQQPLADLHASFRPLPGEEWTWEGRGLLLNGREVEDYIALDPPDIGQLCHLCDSLQAYRGWAHGHIGDRFLPLAYQIDGAQGKILRRLHRLYDEKLGGVSLTWADGQVLLNNLNVRALLTMFEVRPTKKARRFLEGLRHKLALILARQESNPQVSRAVQAVRHLYHDLCASLARETADPLCLPPHPGPVV